MTVIREYQRGYVSAKIAQNICRVIFILLKIEKVLYIIIIRKIYAL